MIFAWFWTCRTFAQKSRWERDLDSVSLCSGTNCGGWVALGLLCLGSEKSEISAISIAGWIDQVRGVAINQQPTTLSQLPVSRLFPFLIAIETQHSISSFWVTKLELIISEEQQPTTKPKPNFSLPDSPDSHIPDCFPLFIAEETSFATHFPSAFSSGWHNWNWSVLRSYNQLSSVFPSLLPSSSFLSLGSGSFTAETPAFDWATPLPLLLPPWLSLWMEVLHSLQLKCLLDSAEDGEVIFSSTPTHPSSLFISHLSPCFNEWKVLPLMKWNISFDSAGHGNVTASW